MEVETSSEQAARTPARKSKMRIDSEESDDEAVQAESKEVKAEQVKKEEADESGEKATATTPAKKTPVTKAPAKKTPPAKKEPVKKESSDSDDGEESESPKKKTPAKAPVKKAPAKKTPTKKAPAKKSPAPKKKATPKKKISESEDSSSSSQDDGDDYEDSSPKKKTPAKKAPVKKATPKKSPAGKKATPAKKTPTKKETPKRAPAKKRKNEDDEDKKPAKRAKKEEGDDDDKGWWEADDLSWKVGEKKNWKWRTLRHNGIVFPPEYEPHGVQMKYNGKEVELNADQEELATFFARYMETDHMKKPQFSVNFFNDWKKVLGKKHVIKDFSKCDFTPILEYLKTQKETKAARSKEEKLKEKEEKAAIKEKYGFATVDGRKEQIGNYTVEPPGLFLGRGDHPKAGMVKARIYPEHITLNLDEDAPVPKCPIKGHKWGGIVHNHEVMWLAFWRQNITNTPKYVLFSANSSLRGRSDMKKFSVAQRLKGCVKDIRKQYMADLESEDTTVMQRATAMWVIDHLALRVGNDKGKDEADTVGCCSLRVEHVKLHEPNKVEFDFLGKDSMPYKNTVEVDDLVFENFKKMLKKKKGSEDIFDRLNPSKLNAHLSSLMPGLSAKVFRTYNASHTMQKELLKYDKKKFKDYTPDQKLLFFNQASVHVAILCNHQRTVSKTHAEQMGKIDEQIDSTKEEIQELKKYIKSGKTPKKSKTEDGEKKKSSFPTSVESAEKKIEKLKERIERLETKKKDKDQLKEVSTSTSKVNYIDPRVTLAWCKKVDLDPKKVFSATLRSKFAWAFAEVEAKPDFKF